MMYEEQHLARRLLMVRMDHISSLTTSSKFDSYEELDDYEFI